MCFISGGSLFDGWLNLRGHPNSATFIPARITVAKGDTMDFVVGFGNQSYGSDIDRFGGQPSNSIPARPTTWPRIFPDSNNPNGPWSYGIFKPGPAPDAATFALYTEHSGNSGLRQHFESRLHCAGRTCSPTCTIIPRVPHTGGIIHILAHAERSHADFPFRIRHRQRGGPVAGDAPFRAVGQSRSRGRPILPGQTESLSGGLATLETGRAVCAAGGFLCREPAQNGRPTDARLERDSLEPERSSATASPA